MSKKHKKLMLIFDRFSPIFGRFWTNFGRRNRWKTNKKAIKIDEKKNDVNFTAKGRAKKAYP